MIHPIIESISDVLPHIAGRDEFVVAQRDGYTAIDYVYALPDSFDDPVRKECRGLKFDLSGKILARPLAKFHNIGERPETQPHLIDFSAPHSITEKLDGCVHRDCMIEFADGSVHPMIDVVKHKLPGPVWGVDAKGRVVPADIVGWSRLPKRQGWKTISVADPKNHAGRSISVTNDHPVMTQRGWIAAGEITTGDRLLRKVRRFSDLQRSVVLGSLLGDMSIQASGGAMTLQWAHKQAHTEYNDILARILAPAHVYRGISNGGWGTPREQCRCCCAEQLDEIIDLTYSGKKTVSDRWLDSLDDVAVAFWYMDDGSMSCGDATKQRPRALFHTEGFDDESIGRIIAFFRRWIGARPSVQEYRGYKSVRLNADDAEVLWARIAQYVVRCMKYKLPSLYRDVPCVWDGYDGAEIASASWVELPVVAIDEGAGQRRTLAAVRYDIQTETGNFFANKLLVHNSMIHASVVDGATSLMTRMGRSDQAKMAEQLLTDNAEHVLMNLADRGITPIFEFTSPANRIVIRYDEPQLTLLAARHMVTGEYVGRGELESIASDLGYPLVRFFPSDWNDAHAFLDYARAIRGAEGFVVRFDDGLWVKAKGDDYVLKHRAKDSILREKNVLALVLSGELDDVIPLLEPEDAIEIERYRVGVLNGITRKADEIWEHVQGGAALDQKTFATQHQLAVAPELRSLAFQVRAGADAYEAVKKYLLKNVGSQTNVDASRHLHGATFALDGRIE